MGVNLPAIIIANGAGIALMIVVLVSQQKSVSYGLLDEKMYYTMVMFTVFQCASEIMSFLVDGNPAFLCCILSRVVNCSLFIINILFALLWIIYADYKMFADLGRIKRHGVLLAAPAVFVILGTVASCFVPFFFSFSAENVYSRAAFYMVPFILTYAYLIYGVVLIYANRKKVQKYLFLPAILFMIPVFAGSILQYCFYGLSFIWLGVSIGLVSLYINMQNEASYIDALSGLFSRQYLNNYLLAQTERSPADGTLAGIMLDVDRFKSINDIYGHQIGDEAISAAGHILRSVVGDRGFAARYAGDEFVIVQKVNSRDEIEAVMQSVREQTARFNRESPRPYLLNFSMGCSLFGEEENDTMDAFLRRIDEGMYADKRQKVETHQVPDRRAVRPK